jgi:protein-L-isoaspartate(D-aspartate) O-methyltransferase
MEPTAPRDLETEPDEAAVEKAAFVLTLRAKGVRDKAVLGAMERVRREIFAPRRFADLARSDVALPIPCGQTMTTPGVIAAMLAALEVTPGASVLEIGTGTGYVTALLLRMGARVHSVERYSTLAESAAARLGVAELTENVVLEVGDGLASVSGEGRFARILVNGASRALPPSLTSRLAAGGRLVGALTVPGEPVPRLFTLDRGEDGQLVDTMGPPVRISPLARGRAAAL